MPSRMTAICALPPVPDGRLNESNWRNRRLQPKAAFSRIPSVHRTKFERQEWVENRPPNLGHFRVETDPEARRKPAPGFCFWRVAGRLRDGRPPGALPGNAIASAPFPSPRAEHDAAPLIRAAPWMGQAAAVVEDPHDAMKVLRSRARIEFEPVQRFQHELPFDSAVAPLPALLALPQAKPGTRGEGGEPMQILLAPKDLRKPDDLLDRNLLLGRALCEHLAPIIRRERGVWALARCDIHQDFI